MSCEPVKPEEKKAAKGDAVYDVCLSCQDRGMVKWKKESSETARACQFCGHVEEKPRAVQVVRKRF